MFLLKVHTHMAQTQVSKYLTFCCNLTCSANSTKYYCCDRKSRVVCAQSFAPWQQATIEIMLAISLCVRLSLRSIVHTLISPELPRRNLSYYCLLALHIMVLFFTHIPFVVNHTINATPPERLQQHPLLFTTNRTDRTFFV